MASKGNNSDVKSKHGGFGAGQIKITPLLQTDNYKLIWHYGSQLLFMKQCMLNKKP